MPQGRTQPASTTVKQTLRAPFLLMAAATVFANLLMLALPLYLIQVYDRILVGRSFETLFYLSLMAVFALAVFGALEAVRGVIAQRAAARFETQVAEPLIGDAVGRAPGEAGARLRDIARVRGFLASRVVQQVFDLPFAPFFLILLFVLHPLLGAIGFAGIVLLLGITAANHRLTRADEDEAQVALGEAHNDAQAVAMRSDDVRAMALLRPLLARWGARQGRALLLADAVAQTNATFYGLTRFSRQALQVGILGAGAYLVLVDQLSAGVIFAASIVSARAFLPIEQVIGSWRAIVNARASARGVLAALENCRGPANGLELPNPKGHLRLEQVSYTVPANGGEPLAIVSDISLDVTPGSILGIVGPSGAGKSTLGRLMVGLETPTCGSVRLDGFELGHWNDDQRGRAFGYVSQDIALFPGTVAETIARFDPKVDDEAIVAAAQVTGAHELIAKLPHGYQTPIGGPGGVRLSGGQRQLIALARAFYGDPKVLVLDEPNAHLDPSGEQSLAGAVTRARSRGAAVIVITQRTPILQVCDHIMGMRNGAIAAIGPRKDMLRPVAKPGEGEAQGSGGVAAAPAFGREQAS